ncbi:MAG: tRNA-dihydrouridine synthase family protein [Desulfobacterales bacterium]
MKHRLCLAPLRGFTTFVFRSVFARFFKGIDLAVAPFVSTVSSTRIKESLLRDILPENNREMPVIPQLIGKNPEDFIALARRLGDMGYDTVNWNLGCPFPQVAKKGRGSGLLPHPDRIDAFLEKVIPAVPVRISIKTRLGRHDVHEIFDLMPVFNRYPITELIIHPRIGVQMYEGKPHLDIFARCLRDSRHPVVYNGDIRTPEDFRKLCTGFPEMDRWMMGRGVLCDPFLPEKIRKPESEREESGKSEEKIRRFREFHNALFAEYLPVFSGTHHLVERMIGYWHYFAEGFAENRKFVRQLRKTRTAEDYMETVKRFLDGEARMKQDMKAWEFRKK